MTSTSDIIPKEEYLDEFICSLMDKNKENKKYCEMLMVAYEDFKYGRIDRAYFFEKLGTNMREYIHFKYNYQKSMKSQDDTNQKMRR